MSNLKTIKGRLSHAQKIKKLVSTMKSFSASKIHEFQSASQSLNTYQQVIGYNLKAMELNGQLSMYVEDEKSEKQSPPDCLVIGSDFGMVGQFNEELFKYVSEEVEHLESCRLFVVGRIMAHNFSDRDQQVYHYEAPLAVEAISNLLGSLLQDILDIELGHERRGLVVFYNTSSDLGFQPTQRTLLPITTGLLREFMQQEWPTRSRPQVICGYSAAQRRHIVRELLFITLFHTIVDSSTAEHKTRLSAMREAERNIDDLVEALHNEYNQKRQDMIDSELFELITGYLLSEEEQEGKKRI